MVGIVSCISDNQENMSFDEVSCLLIRMRMLRQSAIVIKLEFGHQSYFAKDERLMLDLRKGVFAAFTGVFIEHGYHIFSDA